jgi:hypothetical protein
MLRGWIWNAEGLEIMLSLTVYYHAESLNHLFSYLIAGNEFAGPEVEHTKLQNVTCAVPLNF